MMYQIDTAPNSEQISGTVPMEYPIEAELVSIEVTNTSTDGTVKVTLICEGEVVGEEELTEQGASVVLNK